MAKIGVKELQQRGMRERQMAAPVPSKTSRGSTKGRARPVAQQGGPRPSDGFAPVVHTASEGAGIKPGPRETNRPVVAQQVERPICNREDSGSTPLSGTKPKLGRPRIGERPRAEPWADAGMSRRTWYRRQAEKWTNGEA